MKTKNRDYKIVINKEVFEDQTCEWVARYPDLGDIIGVGDTKVEAINEANRFKELYLNQLDQEGIDYPLHTV